MRETPSREEVDAAIAYEELHVPCIFQEWSPRVVDAARVASGDRVLDVACGTGILAREAISRTGDGGTVVGIDSAPGMLAVARKLAPEIAWRAGTAEELPFEDGSFDAVVSQFGLMFFSDRTEALREMMRVLVPQGRLAVAVWDRLENTEAYAIEVEVLDRLGGKPAGDALRAPFVLGDEDRLRSLFERAGVESVAVATHHGMGRFPSIRRMVEADLRGWLPLMGVHLGEDKIEAILAEVEDALDRFVKPDGAVEFDSPAHIVTGSKPARAA